MSNQEVKNNTDFSQEEIEQFEKLGTTISQWRGRTITLYQHPTKEDHVVSVGVTTDQTLVVIAEEEKSGWSTALQYAENGKVYVSQ